MPTVDYDQRLRQARAEVVEAAQQVLDCVSSTDATNIHWGVGASEGCLSRLQAALKELDATKQADPHA